MASRAAAAGAGRRRAPVRWRSIFYHQSYGGFVVLLAAIIITGVSYYLVAPDMRPLRLYDATVSLPMRPNTVPIAAAAAIPFAALVVTVLVIEFGVMHGKQSLTASIHAAIHIIWWAIIGFFVVLALTEATKPWASRLRPDFISRCRPRAATSNAPLKLDGSDTGTAGDCTSGRSSHDLDDGRKSFPSGHSSNSLSLCWYGVLYFVHALYFRNGWAYMGGLWQRRGCLSRLLMEVLQGLFILWAFVMLSIAWCIGITRYRDHRHNIDDILGGFVLALLWMTPTALIAFGQLDFFQARLAEAEAQADKDEREALPLTAPGTPAAVAAAPTATAAAAAEAAASKDAATALAGANGSGQA